MDYSFHNGRKQDRLLSRLGLIFIIKWKNSIKTKKNIRKNSPKKYRLLEIGPGIGRLSDFETLNVIDAKNVDYIHDVTKKFPFQDNSFDLIYASHVMEHVPWYMQKEVFNELYRILKPNGILEIWVPDALKIIKTLYDYETQGVDNIHMDGWYRFNDEKDVIMWGNGRIFSYGDGTGNPHHPNWHKAMFTPRYLEDLFKKQGFKNIQKMPISKVRGYNHGWINLGVKGEK